MKNFKFGAIYYVYDISEGIYNNSYVGLAENSNDFPNLDDDLWMMSDFGLFELTEAGRELYDEWRDDVSCGYDLCYGRCKGLADSIGANDYDIFEYLTNRPEYTKKVEHY